MNLSRRAERPGPRLLAGMAGQGKPGARALHRPDSPSVDHGRTEASLFRSSAKDIRSEIVYVGTDYENRGRHLSLPTQTDLARALDRQELTLVYQPQMTADGQTMASVEALVRWDRPGYGQLGPADFVQMAERTGLIDKLGAYVLERACRDGQAWGTLPVAVNISPTHFASPTFVEELARVVEMTWFKPTRLEIEIVESAAFDDPERAKATIERLKAMGVRVSMDDFGTGFSSLSLLQRLPFDKVKIDKSFVDGIPATRSVAILHAVIALVRALGMKVTAEGVETVEQQRFLKAAGCHYLQGFLFSRPVSPAIITQMLAKQRPVPGGPTARA